MLPTLIGLALLSGAASEPSVEAVGPRMETADPMVDAWGEPLSAGALSAAVADWIVLPHLGAAIQPYDTKTGAPGVRVYLAPGFSGHPTQHERFLFQFPANPGPLVDRALVLAFHSFSTSEESIFLTSIPQECADRGWYLLAPLGLVDVNYGNVQAQEAVDRALAFVQNFFTFNEERVYAMGFSMGGGWALSWAMRHLDPDALRVAAVANHTGTMDLVGTYENGSPEIQGIMSNPLVFGSTPSRDPFAFLRVTPFDLFHGLPNIDASSVSNLLHVPIYHHINQLDNQFVLLAQNNIYKNYLINKGATVSVNEVSVSQPPVHDWSTLDAEGAMDYLAGFSLPPEPDHAELYVDREVPYLYTHPRDIVDDELARYHVTVDEPGNAFTLEESKNLNVISFDLAAMDLESTSVLTITHETLDGTPDEIVLEGYFLPAASITVNGGAPEATSYDSITAELSVTPTADGAPATVVITPATAQVAEVRTFAAR